MVHRIVRDTAHVGSPSVAPPLQPRRSRTHDRYARDFWPEPNHYNLSNSLNPFSPRPKSAMLQTALVSTLAGVPGAQLHLTTHSMLVVAWLRITKVSSILQTVVGAWQRGCRGNFCHACHGYACMVLRLLAWLHRSFNPTPNSRTALAGSSRPTAYTRACYTCWNIYKNQKDAFLQFFSPVTPFTSNRLLNHNQSLATFSYNLQNDHIIDIESINR